MATTAGENVKKNVELIKSALNLLHPSLQDYVVSDLKGRFGEKDWWMKGVLAVNDHNRFNFRDYVLEYTEVSDDTGKSYLDLQTCLKLMYTWKMIPKDLGKTIKHPLDCISDVKNLRNTVEGHSGTDYTHSETMGSLQTIVAFDEIYGLGQGKALKGILFEEMDRYREEEAGGAEVPEEAPDGSDGDRDGAEPAPRPEPEDRQSPGTGVRIAPGTEEPESETPIPSFESLPPGMAALKASEGIYATYRELQEKNTSKARTTSKVLSFEPMRDEDGNDYLLLQLDSPMTFDESAGILVGDRSFDSTHATFDRYNNASKKVRMYPSRELREAMQSSNSDGSGSRRRGIEVYTDMKWLTARTTEFFEEFGGRVSFPPSPLPPGDIALDEELSEEQRSAVRMSLSEPLSYVWGVPGSGKTQQVLATAIAECLRRGERVAVIAPTNLALEQVLRGLLGAFFNKNSFKDVIDPGRDIIRIGTPTADFAGDFPYVCERRGVETRLIELTQEYNLAKRTMLERRYDCLRGLVDECVVEASRLKDGDTDASERLVERMAPVLEAMREDDRFRIDAGEVDASSIKSDVSRIRDMLYERNRSEYLDGEFKEFGDEELETRVADLKKDIGGLRSRGRSVDAGEYRVFAMTLSKFILSYGPEGDDRRRSLDVDHVFVDEAGYCNCVQTLALFTLGVPITLLGDHMQLPPVCEVEKENLKKGIQEAGAHDLDFLWSLSAIYVEHIFDESSEHIARLFLESKEPDFCRTRHTDLTTTFRFGPNLADVLSRHVYPVMSSGSSDDLVIDIVPVQQSVDSIQVKEVNPDGEVIKAYRRNEAEARAVSDIVDSLVDGEDFVILTPYREQLKFIIANNRALKDHVMTIHRSQGREWDTVIVSVCDGRANPPGNPPRFTSSARVIEGERAGLKVINTALSRAKRRLVLVCDADWWTGQEGELIGDIVRTRRE